MGALEHARDHAQVVQLDGRCWRLTSTAAGHGGESADLLLCTHFPSRELAVAAGLGTIDDEELTAATRDAIAVVVREGAHRGAAPCWVIRCADCGLELRDENGDGAVQHFSDAELARAGAVYSGWTPDPTLTVGIEDLVCLACQDHRHGHRTSARHRHTTDERRPGAGQLALAVTDGELL